MSYKSSTFYYSVKEPIRDLDEFVDSLFNKLALRGTAISGKEEGTDLIRVSVKYKDEKGKLLITREGNEVKVVYQVESGGILRKGILDAIIGGGLGGLAGTLLSGDLESVKAALAGALAGGAYGVLDGYNTAMEEATEFSRMLAEAIREVEAELMEERRIETERREMAQREIEELRREFEEIFSDVVALGDEILLLEAEGSDVSKAKGRYEMALRSLEEARRALDKGDQLTARAKMNSARRMAELAREVMR